MVGNQATGGVALHEPLNPKIKLYTTKNAANLQAAVVNGQKLIDL